MITATPDLALTEERLAAELARFQGELAQAPDWRYREKYVDRGEALEPFYILDFRAAGSDTGDDLMDEPLFATRMAALQVKHVTRDGAPGTPGYWRPITPAALGARLDRFLEMFRGGYLQPPGWRDEYDGARRTHERIEGRRFLFRVQSPTRTIVGRGPSAHAGVGAVQGVITKDGAPLAAADVELALADGSVLRRRTDAQGRFWISRVPAGAHRLRVPGHAMSTTVTFEPFGCVRADVTNQSGAAAGIRVELVAPDAEIFGAVSDHAGAVHVGPVPAFPFTVRIPSFLFTANISVRAEASIAATLRDAYGKLRAGAEVALHRDGTEIARTTSDAAGAMRFGDLPAGRYTVTVPGYRLYATRHGSGDAPGTVSAAGAVALELVTERGPGPGTGTP
jgi:hypothetical protein